MLKLSRPRKRTSQTRILVVDDEPDSVSAVESHLRFADCDVVTASNGQEGLEKAAAEMPDLILLDTNMPVMSGDEMLERLRADPDLRRIPVIMLIARCEAQDAAVASTWCVSDYVMKPFDFTQLMDRIQAALLKSAKL